MTLGFAQYSERMHQYNVVEKSIAELRAALESGEVTSVELVAEYMNRIAFYDRHGITLNAVPVLNPDAFAEARASDQRRSQGETLSPLDGIPYTAKNSYKARGLTVASGSPAFRDLVATDDAFTISQLRKGGAVLVGLTNMPPMANGGMQRGVYGRAESPYNPDFLTAAFGSGSSNGSGTATAASFAAFGLGEETWSSGRAPASNNGLCAYTPSRGVISVRGNWPLVPTMDVVVPHTRTMTDMLELLNVVVDDDDDTRGDFWRTQPWILIPKSSALRPRNYERLENRDALAGKTVGVPRMYINKDTDSTDQIVTRDSVIELWESARADLEAAGATVLEVDFPVVTNYEAKGTGDLVTRGLVPAEFAERELMDLVVWSWNDFLDANADPQLHALADVDGPAIFPVPTGSVPGQYDDHKHRYAPDDVDLADYVTFAAEQGVPELVDIPTIRDGVIGLEEARRIDLEQWMNLLGLDVIVFPAAADVGPADADVNLDSAQDAWRNGVWVSNGNLVPRHLGIPTVTVPMGVMSDIGMPVGLTFAGRSYEDNALLSYGWAFEQVRSRRVAAPRTPELPDLDWVSTGITSTNEVTLEVSAELHDTVVTAHVHTTASEVAITINGVNAAIESSANGTLIASAQVDPAELDRLHSEWRGNYGQIVTVVVRGADDEVLGQTVIVGGVA